MIQSIIQSMRGRRQRLVLGLAILLTWGVTMPLVLGALGKKDIAWQHIQESGALRVGMDASYPPFETIDPATGQPVGFDVDLANQIGRRLGVKVAFTNIAYDGLYDSLLTGNVDVLISAMVDLPQFQGKAAFSVPYFNAGEMLIVRQGSPYHGMDDMASHTVAVEYGSGGDVEARKWQRRINGLEVKRYPDPAAALKAVSDGETDAAIVDGIAGRLGVGQGDGLAAEQHLVDTLFAAAVASDNDVLRGKLDEIIREMAADGTLSRLTDKWFGPQQPASSP